MRKWPEFRESVSYAGGEEVKKAFRNLKHYLLISAKGKYPAERGVGKGVRSTFEERTKLTKGRGPFNGHEGTEEEGGPGGEFWSFMTIKKGMKASGPAKSFTNDEKTRELKRALSLNLVGLRRENY